MTRNEAIVAMRFYKEKLYNGIFNRYIDAFDMAIAALKEQESLEKKQATETSDKRGRWEPCGSDVDPKLYGRCSECGTVGCLDWKGCPVCLARMDGDGNG